MLLLVATGERKIRIETGKGVGGDLTDLESNQIIRERIGPELKRGSYAAGIEAGVDAIAAKLTGTAPPRSPNAPPEWFPAVLVLGLLLTFFVVIFAMVKMIRGAGRRGGSSGGSYQGTDYSSSSDSSSGGGGATTAAVVETSAAEDRAAITEACWVSTGASGSPRSARPRLPISPRAGPTPSCAARASPG